MNFTLQRATTESRDAVVAAMRGAGDGAAALTEVVSGMMARTMNGSRELAETRELMSGRITGAVYGVTEIGGELEEAARSIMLGTMRAAHEAGREGAEVAKASATTLTLGVYEVGGDVAKAAKGAVEGAIESASDLGMSAEEAASAAASGALEAAADIGRTSLGQVRETLSDSVRGVKLELREPLNPALRRLG